MGTDNLDRKFHVGDRVVLTIDHPYSSTVLTKGCAGTVCGFFFGAYAVNYDIEDEELHSCHGKCENGHGWYTEAMYLVNEDAQGDKAKDDDIAEPCDEHDLISFLGIS